MDFLEHLEQSPGSVQNVLDSKLDLSQFKVCFGYWEAIYYLPIIFLKLAWPHQSETDTIIATVEFFPLFVGGLKILG